LVAEITSAFVCASLGIVPTVRHSDYIGSWLEVLREDDRSIVLAASAASKAADYLLAFCPESNECVQGVESSNHLLVSDRQETALIEAPRCQLQARPSSVRGRPLSP
jgi:antirestriction protein ArdC